MNRIIAFLLLNVGFASQSFSQDFDLNNYKFRYQNYRGFTLGSSLQNRNNLQFYSIEDKIDSSFDFRNNGNGNIAFDFNTQYFSYTNTENLQKSTFTSLSENLSLDRNMDDDTRFGKDGRRSLNNNLNIRFGQTIRKYTGEKFKLMDYNLYTYLYNYKSEYLVQNATNTESNRRFSRSTADLKTGIGTGRLEYVSDAVSALFIAQDLEKKLGVSLSTNQKEELAKGITFIRNQRFLDFRFKLIDQIAMLDSVLKANGIVNENAVKYFSTLNDNWLYATNLNRLSGKRWTNYFAFNSSWDFEKYNNMQDLGNNSFTYNRSIDNWLLSSLQIGIDYDYSYQKSLKTQRSYGILARTGPALSWHAVDVTTSFSPIAEKLDNAFTPGRQNIATQLSGYWQHLYQPNTRNTFTAEVRPSILLETALDDSEYITFLPQVDFRLDYYKWISPQLNFNVGLRSNFANTNYLHSSYKSSNNMINNNLTAGFNYQFY